MPFGNFIIQTFLQIHIFLEATLFDIKRFAVHDGPGIRTTLFFKGCPLHCSWCHNPEGISPKMESYTQKVVLDKKQFESEQTIGKLYTVEQLVHEALKDQVFYQESGGGITLSGGEPLLQFKFLKHFLHEIKKQNIHVTLDTSGYAPQNILSQMLPLVDLFLFDIKQLDEAKHKSKTRVGNATIVANLQTLFEAEKEIIVRIPLIPGFNTDDGSLNQFKEFFEQFKARISEVHLLPYHHLANNKYKNFQRENLCKNIEQLTKLELDEIYSKLNIQGLTCKLEGQYEFTS